MASEAERVAAELRQVLGAEAVATAATPIQFSGDVVSTGSLGLDEALGVGGFPMGRVVEVYGPESSGKTTLALHTLANAQRAGHLCGFIDAEHALDMTYAETLGVDPQTLLLSQPDTGEQGLNAVKAMLAAGVRVIVVDSVAALTPKKEIEGDVGDTHVGLQARMMGQALRMIAGATKKSGSLVMFINQLRMKIGVMFGSPETTTGGHALKFYSSVRVDVRNKGKIKLDGTLYGQRCRLRVVKNKVAPPFQEVELDLIWGRGFDMAAQILDIGTELGVIAKSGSHYSFGGEKIANGRAKAVEVLRAQPELLQTLEEVVREEMNE